MTVASLRELLAKATPGPWIEPNGGTVVLQDHDTALIVAAVNGLSALLDVVEAAEAAARVEKPCDTTLIPRTTARTFHRDTCTSCALKDALARLESTP